MNLMDLAILIVLALLTIRGVSRGIILEMTSLFGFLVSFFLAYAYYRPLTFKLIRYLPNYPILLAFLSFILLFFIIYFILQLLARAARGAIRLAFLGWLDRGLGGLLGLVKGVLISMILIALLLFFSPKATTLTQESRLYAPMQTLTGKIIYLIPSAFKEDFQVQRKKWQEYWWGKGQNLKNMYNLKDNE
jgi:membrane protein required for colicin V production